MNDPSGPGGREEMGSPVVLTGRWPGGTRLPWILMAVVLILGGGPDTTLADETAPAPYSVPCSVPCSVGVLLPLSGPLTLYGRAQRAAFTLVEQRVNSRGGIHGEKIHFLFRDTRGRVADATARADHLVREQGVLLLTGGVNSDVARAIAHVAMQHRIPYLASTAMAERLTGSLAPKEDEGEGSPASVPEPTLALPLFRLNPPVTEVMASLEVFVNQVVHPENAAIIYEAGLFGKDAEAAFGRMARHLGVHVTSATEVSGDLHDLERSMAGIRVKNQDLLVLASESPLAEKMVLQAMKAWLTPGMMVGIGRGFNHHEFAERVGRAGEKLFTLALWHQAFPFPGTRDLLKESTRLGGELNEEAAMAHAAAMVIIEALRRGRDPDSIVQALEGMNRMTAIGPVRFEKTDTGIRRNRSMVVLTQLVEGRQWIVWPQHLANRGFVYPVDWVAERR